MTIVIGKRYLRCPKADLRIIEHLECHSCPNLIGVKVTPYGQLDNMKKYVSVECLFGNMRRTTGTVPGGETERLSNL